MSSTERRVDHNAIRTNQVFTIALLALAFVLDWPVLAGLVATIMFISAVKPPLGLFTRIYRHILRPAGLVKPDVQLDNPEPHRFAQLLGSIVVALGVAALLAGSQLGWVSAGNRDYPGKPQPVRRNLRGLPDLLLAEPAGRPRV